MEMITRIIKGSKINKGFSEDGERTLVWSINGTPYNEVVIGEYGNFVLSPIKNLSVVNRFKNADVYICGTVISITNDNNIIVRNEYGTDMLICVDRCISHERLESVSSHFVENSCSTIKVVTNNSIFNYNKISKIIDDAVKNIKDVCVCVARL